MMKAEVEERVLAVFRKNPGLATTALALDTSFDTLHLDSLDVINIIFDLEDEFQVSIPDQGVVRLRTIRDAIDCIAALPRKGE